MKKRGVLLVFEGTDCSGKSTQINLFVERLKNKGKSVVVLDFPNYSTPTGKIVRRYLDNEFGPANSISPKFASILYAEDRFASKQIILDALENNDFVILDRYVESNMGHQGGKVKDPEERKQFFKWLEELEYKNFELPKPDAIIFLYMPWDISKKLKQDRIKKSEFHPGKEDGHESNDEHMINAGRSYLQLADLFNWIKIECATEGDYNSLRTPENIAEEVYEKIESALNYSEKEKIILDYFFTNKNNSIFVAKNFHPEVWALMQARYSRSSIGMRESFLKLLKEDEQSFNELYDEICKTKSGIASEHATQKAVNFMEKWVTGFGHSSIAEGAVAGIGIEGISILATKVIEDNRLSSFCEKSTRYVSFDKDSFFIDEDLKNSEFSEEIQELINLLFETYKNLHEPVLNYIKRTSPREDEISESSWERSCSARRFDAVRYLLPVCTKTSLGWTVNARELSHGISKLLSHPLKEMNEIGRKIRKEAVKVFPSLLKYAEKNDYYIKTDFAMNELFGRRPYDSFDGKKVKLVNSCENIENTILASILYKYHNQSYEKSLEKIKLLSNSEKEKIFDDYLSYMGPHDKPLRELEHSLFTFDIIIDYGAFRDLQRQRICTQTNPILNSDLGYEIPQDIIDAGVEREYCNVMEKAKELYEKVREFYPLQSQYLLPLAFRKRFLISMNLREFYYFIQLRSSPKAHPSYRKIAQEMYEIMKEKYPLLCKYIKCNYSEEKLGRLKQEQKIENAI